MDAFILRHRELRRVRPYTPDHFHSARRTTCHWSPWERCALTQRSLPDMLAYEGASKEVSFAQLACLWIVIGFCNAAYPLSFWHLPSLALSAGISHFKHGRIPTRANQPLQSSGTLIDVCSVHCNYGRAQFSYTESDETFPEIELSSRWCRKHFRQVLHTKAPK